MDNPNNPSRTKSHGGPASGERSSKGHDQRWLSERYGKRDDGSSNHPITKRDGRKGASNAGEDESSGSE